MLTLLFADDLYFIKADFPAEYHFLRLTAIAIELVFQSFRCRRIKQKNWSSYLLT